MRADLWWRHQSYSSRWTMWYRDHQVSPEGIRPEDRETGRFRNLLEADLFARWLRTDSRRDSTTYITRLEGEDPNNET